MYECSIFQTGVPKIFNFGAVHPKMYLDNFAFANLELERFVRLSIAVKLLCIVVEARIT